MKKKTFTAILCLSAALCLCACGSKPTVSDALLTPTGAQTTTAPTTPPETTIGEQAFAYCRALTEVSIPGSVTTIGSGAFSYCYALTEVSIPASVTTIERGYGSNMFSDCNALTTIVVPAGSYAESWLKENGYGSKIKNP